MSYNEKWLSEKNKGKISQAVFKNYELIKKNESDSLLICFTGQGKVVLFDFYKTFTNSNFSKNINVIFFGDSFKGFYLNGVLGFSSSPEDTADKINELCIKNNYKKIYLVGTSMGGFGAIMHGLILSKFQNINDIKILVFNPHTFLAEDTFKERCSFLNRENIFYCRQRGINKRNCQILFTNWQRKYWNLKNFKNSNEKIKLKVIYGNTEKEENRINILKSVLDGEYRKFMCRDHNIAKWLKDKNILSTILEDFLKEEYRIYENEIF